MNSLNTSLVTAAEANPNVAPVIDMRNAARWTGTGFAGSPANGGNADFFMYEDEVHASHAGHEKPALRLADNELSAMRA